MRDERRYLAIATYPVVWQNGVKLRENFVKKKFIVKLMWKRSGDPNRI